ncbi:MAG: M28 family peptidase, partial [candidate division NC10 bacterium]
GRAGRALGIPAVHVTRAVADALLAPSGKRLADLQQAIDRGLGPQSFLPGGTARLEVGLIRERGTAQNVVGILRGTDPKLSDEAIVIGAHYDHLGRGNDAHGRIYPGADDNASGTAGLMALARALVTAGGLPRTAIFAAFAGEEMGLLGSSHYVKQPPVPLERTVFMLNMDMIGRLRGGRLYVSGVESGAELRALVKESATGLPLDLRLRGDPFGPSDHSPFYSRELPVLLLTTGVHADYHKPTDSWEKIDPQGMEVVLTFASRLIAALGSRTPPPVYVKLSPPSGRGSGTFFGVTFDGAEEDRPGVKLGGIAAGSPADRAGVKPGDLIVKFAGVPVTAPDDLIVAVRARRPGETVEVVLFRDGTEHRLAATLGDRR